MQAPDAGPQYSPLKLIHRLQHVISTDPPLIIYNIWRYNALVVIWLSGAWKQAFIFTGHDEVLFHAQVAKPVLFNHFW